MSRREKAEYFAETILRLAVLIVDPKRELPEVERREAGRKLALLATNHVEQQQTAKLLAAPKTRNGAAGRRLANTVEVRRVLQGSEAERVH